MEKIDATTLRSAVQGEMLSMFEGTDIDIEDVSTRGKNSMTVVLTNGQKFVITVKERKTNVHNA